MTEDNTEMKWRDLALQFDGHRMQAISFLKVILSEFPDDKYASARDFIKSGPLSGEEVLRNRIAALTQPASPALKLPDEDYFSRLVAAARERAEKAMRKFPQPNYVLNKVAEENGEVIKAVIHYTEGREDWLSVEGELIDNLAMLIRLVKEGDQVIGFNPPDEVKRLNAPHTVPIEPICATGGAEWVKCSERMPEIGSTILVHMQDPIHSATPYAVATYDKYGFSRSKVTHWMPLPPAPEAE